MPERYIKPQQAVTHHANRPTLSRELLAMLGAHADVDASLLFVCDADGVAPWTLIDGATLEATGAERGARYASQNRLVLASQNAQGNATLLGGAGGLAAGTYVLRIHHVSAAAVAGDLCVSVRNVTDATNVLAPTTFSTTTSDGFTEILVTIRASDAGDTLELRIWKATATANTIRVDYAALHPAAARRMPYGEIPPGGSRKLTYAGDNVASHTIYDSPNGTGNVVETAAYTYEGDDLQSIAYTRDGKTATKTFVYASGNLDYVHWSI